MAVKISSKLPNEDRSGLDLLHGDLVKYPANRHLIIAVVDCARTTIDHEGELEQYTPTAGVLFVEPVIAAEDRELVTEVMERLRAERLGTDTLDFDFGIGDPLADAGKLVDSGAEVVRAADG